MKGEVGLPRGGQPLDSAGGRNEMVKTSGGNDSLLGAGWTEPEGEAEELRQKHSDQSCWSSMSAAAG